MRNFTELQNDFLDALEAEAYGGTIFTDDVVARTKQTGTTMSGVISSLIQRNIILVADDGMIGIVVDANDAQFPIYGVEWEVSSELVKEVRELANKQI